VESKSHFFRRNAHLNITDILDRLGCLYVHFFIQYPYSIRRQCRAVTRARSRFNEQRPIADHRALTDATKQTRVYGAASVAAALSLHAAIYHTDM